MKVWSGILSRFANPYVSFAQTIFRLAVNLDLESDCQRQGPCQTLWILWFKIFPDWRQLCSYQFMAFVSGIPKQTGSLRGSVKLKKIQKSEKDSEVGGWIKHQLGFFFFFEMLYFFVFFCVVFMFSNVSKKKNWIGGWVGGIWLIRVFLGFLDFF